MTKQSVSTTTSNTEEYKIADEELNEDLILRSWKGVEQQVQRVIEFNKSQNVPNPDQYIGYVYDGSPMPMSIKQKVRWLNVIKQKKSGAPRTVDNLVASGQISDIEKEMFGSDRKYPRIEIHTMTRIKTRDNKEYLVRGMRGFGLSEIGGIVTLPLYDVDFTRKVPVIPATAKDKDGNDIKILSVGSGEFTYESSPKIYITPFTKENVLSTIEKYPPSDDNGLQGKITYNFKREDTNNELGISSLEEFLGDFDSIWSAKTQPTPTISIDSKGLLNYAKLERESREQHKQYS